MVPHAGLVPALAGRIADALYDWLSDWADHRVEVLRADMVLRQRSGRTSDVRCCRSIIVALPFRYPASRR